MKIGIVGHRHIENLETASFVARECRRILKGFLDESSNLVVLSALAEGADTIFAEAALDVGIPLDIVQPFDSYASEFVTHAAHRRYNALRSSARNEVRLRFPTRSNEAYETAMSWIVMESDILVAVWNGAPANGPGGTGHAVSQAVRLDKRWIHVNVSTLTVVHHSPRKYSDGVGHDHEAKKEHHA